jgi:hypothetical protein
MYLQAYEAKLQQRATYKKQFIYMQVIKTVAEDNGFGHKPKGRSSRVMKAGIREVKNEEKYTTAPIPFVNDLCKSRWALL